MTVKRRVQPIGLVASLILAPGLAGLIGGLLVFLGTLPLVFEGGYTPGPDGDLAASVIGASLLSMTVGVMFSYVIGTPFILGAWLCVHLFTARRTIHLVPAIAVAGALFSWLLFGGFLRQLDASVPASAVVMALAPLVSGALAGASVGAVISGLGYSPVPAVRPKAEGRDL
jgi:hypothetical protein